MNCPNCSADLVLAMHLAKDGTVYEVWRCGENHHVVRDTRRNDLPVEISEERDVHVARVLCGANCCIFDRRMFRAAVRHVLRLCRSRSSHLVLDLSRVGLVGEGLLSCIRFLDNGLKKRGFRLQVIAASAAVRAEILCVAPNLDGRIFGREGEARAGLGLPAPQVAAGGA